MKDFQTISVRIPIYIFKRIKDIAEKEHRSINQQINMYMKEQLEKAEAIS